MAHNKTLAAQLASEFKEFFPNNAVEYFVSYYDYYQPEAYIPRTDTYIEKDTLVNEDIERLRHSAMQSLLTRRDVLVVASRVAASTVWATPRSTARTASACASARSYKRDKMLRRLTDIYYERNDYDLARGQVPRARRHAGGPPVVAGDRGADLVLGRRGRAHHRGRPADRRGAGRSARPSTIYPARYFVTSRQKLQDALQRHRGRDGRAGARSSSSRTSCSKRSGCASAPSTTWRCWSRPASARASRTTRATCRGARPAARRGRCWTTFPTTSCASSTNRT